MGFPEGFKIKGIVSDTQAYRQFGNSVAVPVVEAVAGKVLSYMNENLISNDKIRQTEVKEAVVEDFRAKNHGLSSNNLFKS